MSRLRMFIILIMVFLLSIGLVSALTPAKKAYMDTHAISFWTMDENGASYRDITPNAHHMVSYFGGTYGNQVGGIVNFSQNFNGVDDAVRSTDALIQLDITKNFSYSLWINITTRNNEYAFGTRNQTGNIANQFYVYPTIAGTDKILFAMCGVDNQISLTSGTQYHVAVVKNDSSGRQEIWVNGVWVNGTSYGADCIATENNYIFMGARPNAGALNSFYDGRLDEVVIFDNIIDQEMIQFLYNGGAPGISQRYPFSGGAAPTANFSIVTNDEWSGSSIISFNATINGTVYQSNASGVIETDLNNNLTYNVTISSANYFSRTYYEYNTSVDLTAELHQAEVCFDASAKVSSVVLSSVTFKLGILTQNCYNITAGTYNVQASKTNWFLKNQSFTITPLMNTTLTVQNLSSANLTIYAKDGTTNQSLSNYNININSITYPAWTGETHTGVTNKSIYLINATYNVSISKPGYAVTTSKANITITGHKNYTFTLYKTNSVTIYIRDEITNLPIYDNITIRWSDNTTTWENITDDSLLFVHNITAGNYTLLFYSSNYSTRTYSITVGPSSTQFLTAYMISSTYSTIFTIKDIDTGSILDGVSITMYKLINSSWTTVESKVSDISGKAKFYYDPIANYRFYLSNADYNDYIFYLNPILFPTYDVFMTKTSVLNYSVDFDDISFIYSPHSFTNNENKTLNFLISSPSGSLTDYGIKVTYPGGTDSDSGVNAIGEQMSVDINITGATTWNYVVLNFNYTTSLAGTRQYQFNLPINVNVTTNTFLTNKDKTYGLGIFERMLIATLLILFVVGIGTMIGQAIPGIALGMFVYMFLVFIGFVPLWVILPSMLIGVLFLVWKSGGY